MVLRIEFEDRELFIDPTLSLQGGDLKDHFFPSYHYGLPLSKQSTGLIPLPKSEPKKPIFINATFSLKNPSLVEMQVTRDYEGQYADNMRRRLTYGGYKKISENFLSYTQSLFRGVTTLSPLKCLDDPKSNHFTLQEAYSIPLRSRKGKTLRVKSRLIQQNVETDINPARKTPYALKPAVWMREHIHVNHLAPSTISTEKSRFEHDSFIFRFTCKQEGKEADFDFEIKFLKDYISPEHIASYNAIMSEIEALSDIELHFEQKE